MYFQDHPFRIIYHILHQKNPSKHLSWWTRVEGILKISRRCLQRNTFTYSKRLRRWKIVRLYYGINIREAAPEVFCKTGVIRNFAQFTGKHLCQSLFFNKVGGLRPATLLKKTSGRLLLTSDKRFVISLDFGYVLHHCNGKGSLRIRITLLHA